MTRPGSSRTAPTNLALGLSAEGLRALVERALEEDIGAGDLTTRLTIAEDAPARGVFISQQALVVAGLPIAEAVLRALDSTLVWEALIQEGSKVGAKTPLAAVRGKAPALLAGERVALNFLQRLSGIASMTWHLKEQLRGLKAELLDTRKTTPGLKALEKYAVRAGGGRNHRLRLDDGILIKNNHLRLAGGVRRAVEAARRNRPPAAADFPIEVEVQNLAELDEALASGAEAVLLDNMTPAQVKQSVERARGRARIEVSGGINAANIRAYAEAGVDAISVGALTHSAPAAPIHFLIEPLER